LTDSHEPDPEYALPLIRRELIRVANRERHSLTAREVKQYIIATVQRYGIETLVGYIEADIDLNFTVGVFRNTLDKPNRKK
jgi:hypothetical protein